MPLSVDDESLRGWLECKNQWQRQALATRSSLRSLPFVLSASHSLRAPLLLASLRASITSLTATNSQNTKMRAMANSSIIMGESYASAAHEAANCAARSALQAAEAISEPSTDILLRSIYNSFDAAFSAGELTQANYFYRDPVIHRNISGQTSLGARESMQNELISDAGFLEGLSAAESAYRKPLWQDDEPVIIEASMKALRSFWASSPEVWFFWQRWYGGILSGVPLDWELQNRVVLIENSVWNEGAKAVGKEIQRIETILSTEIYPRLERDEYDGLFHIQSEPLPPEEVTDFVCQRTMIALKVAAQEGNTNSFGEDSPEFLEIMLSLRAEHRSISVLATGFFSACLSLNSRIGDVYPEDTSLVNLKNTLWGATEELCALDDLARVRCARISSLEVSRSVNSLEREEISSVFEVVAVHVDQQAGEVIKKDIEYIISHDRPPKTVRARFTSWMTTISMWMDRAKKLDSNAKWLSDLVDRLRTWWGGSPLD